MIALLPERHERATMRMVSILLGGLGGHTKKWV